MIAIKHQCLAQLAVLTKTHCQLPMDVQVAKLKEFFDQNIVAALNFVLDKLCEHEFVVADDIVMKDSALEILKKLRDCSESLKEFFSLYPSWRDDRIQCIRNISYIADEIERHNRNANIVRLQTVGLGIVSGVLGIAGIALAPVTAGASVGLTIAGLVVGVSAAATSGRASIAEVAFLRKKKKEANECFENHKKNTANLVELIQKFATCSDEIDKSFNDKVITFVVNCIQTVVCNSKDALVVFYSVASFANAVYSLVKGIPQAVIFLKNLLLLITESPVLHSVFDFAFTPTKLTGAGAQITEQTLRVSVKAGAPAVAAFGYIEGIVGIGVSGAVGAYTIYNMTNNKNETDASKKLRKLCSQLEDEFCEVKKVYNMLKNGEVESEC